MSHGQVRAGYWIDNILQGYSRYIGNQGEFYEGNLQNLKFTGLCKHINRLGKVRIGYFRENRPLGESSFPYLNILDSPKGLFSLKYQ